MAIHNLNLTLKKPFILICLFGQDDEVVGITILASLVIEIL
ncbi:hypothetical protein [uncultured Gammaproteobacteria bacterium]|nr:hypothetical protein [uncultured Gammaproteobacteria bacterium]